MPSSAAERAGDLGEAAADDAAPEAEPVQGADQGPGARGQPQLAADRVEHGFVQPGQHCDAFPERGGEVQFAAHGGLGDLGHLLRAAGPGGEQVNHLAGDQRGVHVHHDQPHGPPVQPAALHGHVHALLRRLPGQRHPERGRIGAGYVQLDTGHRAVREPVDAVDVRPAGRDPARDGRHRGRRQRAAQHGDMQPSAAPGLLAGAHRYLGIQAEVGGDRADGPVDRGQVRIAAAAEQRAKHQPPPDHHLLDVQHGQLLPGQGGEQPGGHPGPVPAGQGDQECGLRVHRWSTLPGPGGRRALVGWLVRHDVSSGLTGALFKTGERGQARRTCPSGRCRPPGASHARSFE